MTSETNHAIITTQRLLHALYLTVTCIFISVLFGRVYITDTGNCSETRIGDQFTRGVSGGERKRCNIGLELIPSPGILFLDEPTTGLDASTAHSVMVLLKRSANHK